MPLEWVRERQIIFAPLYRAILVSGLPSTIRIMELHPSPATVYQHEKERHSAELQALKKRHSLYGWLRLIAILLTAGLAFYLFTFSLVAGWGVIIMGFALFLVLVSLDTDIAQAIRTTHHLLELNEEELKVLSGDFGHRFDGQEFTPDVHDYAGDLDVFGKASLYQYINRCHSEQGKKQLSEDFLYGVPVAEALERQEAIRELAPLYQWRQLLEVYARQTPVTHRTQKVTEAWLSEEETYFSGWSWKYILPVYSVLTIGSAIAALMGVLPSAVFGGLFLLYFIFSGSLSKRAMSSYMQLNGIVKEVETMRRLIRWIEEREFQSVLLLHLQQSVAADATKAHTQIKALREILNRFDLRLNALVFLFLNSFVLWDVRQMRALNQWRQRNRQQVGKWFSLIAEFEVLNSLSTLHFNQPRWAWPAFSQHQFTFMGQGVGHPLITEERRVVNDFSLQGRAKVALVTGSNMAGKSTFLRSLGVNQLLAQMGAPVCAQKLMVSPVRLMTSMRIADNLAENTSTFYAELKKLKTIIDAIRRKEPVWVLLDEVLRGTNSMDRHIGLKALIRQIVNHQAVSVIATHDVEVAALGGELPGAIENYHFDVQVEGEELYFDYQLKEGVCTSLNASILMKKIGIELE